MHESTSPLSTELPLWGTGEVLTEGGTCVVCNTLAIIRFKACVRSPTVHTSCGCMGPDPPNMGQKLSHLFSIITPCDCTAGGYVAFGALDAAAAMAKITPLKPGTSSVTGVPLHDT